MNSKTDQANVVPLRRVSDIDRADNAALIRQLYTCLNEERPLIICLDAANMVKLESALTHGAYPEETKLRDPNELIRKELQFWLPYISQRNLAYMEFRYNTGSFELYNVTGLIHRISNTLNLVKCAYQLTIPSTLVSVETLALFKGLGFDHCLISIDNVNDESIDKLAVAIQYARPYSFSKLGVHITGAFGMENLANSVKSILNTHAPDYIFVGSSTHLIHQEHSTEITLFEEDVKHGMLDKLQLGPGAISEFNRRAVNSIADADSYVYAIENGKLPITKSTL